MSTPLPLSPIAHGKVRDVYALDDQRLLLVASDRISAFDVVLPTPIAGKGQVLTRLSVFWFGKLACAQPHHLLGAIEGEANCPVTLCPYLAELVGRSMICRRAKIFPVECIVRGYLAGSGWASYRETGEVCGVKLPAGLKLADRLPEPIFTPTSKEAVGKHDEPLTWQETVARIGPQTAEAIRTRSLALYQEAAAWAEPRGVILADSKFEFGVADDGTLLLCDEILTPDSSRFWPKEEWQPGREPPSFDKQFVRDYLQKLCNEGKWNKQPPGPELPADIVVGTQARYQEALQKLTQ